MIVFYVLRNLIFDSSFLLIFNTLAEIFPRIRKTIYRQTKSRWVLPPTFGLPLFECRTGAGYQ